MNELNSKLIVAMVVVPTLFGLFATWKEMTASAVAICLALAFSNLDKLSSFKGAGFEAQMRDVKTAVDKTYAAIDELKELALSLSAPIIDEMAVSGKMLIFIPLEEKLERVEVIANRLKKLGASEKEISDACSTLYNRVSGDHLRRIVYALRDSNPSKSSLFEGLDDWNFGEWTLNRLQTFITENALVKSDDVNEALLDLEFFSQKHKLRRPEKWQS